MDDKSVIRAFDTINQMLIDRKTIKEEDRKTLAKKKDRESISCETIGNVHVLFYLHNKFTTKDFCPSWEGFENIVKKSKNPHLIFVYKDKFTTANEKTLRTKVQDKSKDKVKIETFCIKNLLFNITKHELVPKHELLDLEEAKKIYDRYSIKDNQKVLKLPLLVTKTDPVAKYYDFKHKDLVKITRPSSSIGEAISYRYCV